jgi:predicted permease
LLANLFPIIAPLFFIAGLGFVWGRQRWPFDTAMITPITMNVSVPCLIFSSIARLEVDPLAFGELVAAVVATIACFLALGALALRLFRLPVRTYLPSLAFPNVGNMGLPLSLFAFGETGLALGMSWYVVCGLGHFTIGVWIASGHGSPAVLLRSPVVYALAAALAFLLTGTPAPQWALNTVKMLGEMGLPLMLMTLGVSLASIRIVGLKRAAGLAVLRLGMGVAVGVAVAEAFGLTGVAWSILVMDAAMPVAVFNFILAERYGQNSAEVASTVVISTALSFATLPLLLLLVLPP